MLPSPQHGFLRKILCLMHVPRHAKRKAPDVWSVFFQQRSHRTWSLPLRRVAEELARHNGETQLHVLAYQTSQPRFGQISVTDVESLEPGVVPGIGGQD
jgi:hypothetical protein